MTPAQQIRRAAARLRETAAGATPGPWRRRSGNRVSSNVHAREDVVIDGGGWTDGVRAVVYGAALNADADWIALVNPALAEPLVSWLYHSAEELSVATMYARDHGCDPVDLLDEPDSVRHALAVARAINGGTS